MTNDAAFMAEQDAADAMRERELAHMREACRLLRAAESVDFREDRTLEYAALNKWLTADNPDAAENEWNKANNGGMP